MKKAAWIIPSFIEGSGGYRTIFQHINYMAGQYECHVYVYDSGDFKDERQLAKKAEYLYGNIKCHFHMGYDLKRQGNFELVIATAWFTAYEAAACQGAEKKAYFVQDFEPLFYPVDNRYIDSENSYRLGLQHITIGRWLAWKLQKEFQARVRYFDFCADPSIYYKLDGRLREKAVCFIYQPEKPRRCSDLGLKALYIVKCIIPEVRIYLYGSNGEAAGSTFEYENKGIISPQECNELYNRCQVGLCISATNPSRIPFEMMAAGLPVVDIYRENNLFDYIDGTILLAQSSPEAIAQAIIDVLSQPLLQETMSACGQRFVSERGLEQAMNQFLRAINDSDDIKENAYMTIDKLYQGPPVLPGEDILLYVKKLYLSKLLENRSFIGRLKRVRWIRKIPGIKKIGRILKNG